MGLFVGVRSWKWGDECVGYYAKNYHLTIHFWGLSAKCWNVEAWGGFLWPNLRWNRGFLNFFFVFTFIFEDYFGWKIIFLRNTKLNKLKNIKYKNNAFVDSFSVYKTNRKNTLSLYKTLSNAKFKSLKRECFIANTIILIIKN